MLLELLIVSMIVIGVRWLKKIRTPVFMEWDNYKKKVDFLDMFYFQQSCRKQSIRNSEILKIKC